MCLFGRKMIVQIQKSDYICLTLDTNINGATVFVGLPVTPALIIDPADITSSSIMMDDPYTNDKGNFQNHPPWDFTWSIVRQIPRFRSLVKYIQNTDNEWRHTLDRGTDLRNQC